MDLKGLIQQKSKSQQLSNEAIEFNFLHLLPVTLAFLQGHRSSLISRIKVFPYPTLNLTLVQLGLTNCLDIPMKGYWMNLPVILSTHYLRHWSIFSVLCLRVNLHNPWNHGTMFRWGQIQIVPMPWNTERKILLKQGPTGPALLSRHVKNPTFAVNKSPETTRVFLITFRVQFNKVAGKRNGR